MPARQNSLICPILQKKKKHLLS
jgi:type IV pilus assembly protein PilA